MEHPHSEQGIGSQFRLCAIGDSEADHLKSLLLEWQTTETPSSKNKFLERHPLHRPRRFRS